MDMSGFYAPAAAEPGNNPGTHWIWGWVGLLRRSDVLENNFLPPTGIQTSDRSARSLLAIGKWYQFSRQGKGQHFQPLTII
jgi:hypothetical protein